VLYVSVGQVARALGVTPDTVRRWTSTGFLPCVRTAGGHRRIAQEDVDELGRAIGGDGHLQARRAREREVDTLAQASIDLTSMLNWQELLAAIARHVTRLCDCSSCAISGYDAAASSVSLLAEYDARGSLLPQVMDFALGGYPVTRRVLEEQTPVVVNVDDRGADPAEVKLLRRLGVRSVLMAPLVFRDQTMGLLEAMDWERSRRYSPQELRLVKALAGHAAVAMRNVELFQEGRESGGPDGGLRARLGVFTERIADLGDLCTQAERPTVMAQLACGVFAARSCLIARDGQLVGAAMAPAPLAREGASCSASRGC
jgi:excisionase family DNA binding protein